MEKIEKIGELKFLDLTITSKDRELIPKFIITNLYFHNIHKYKDIIFDYVKTNHKIKNKNIWNDLY